MASLCKPPPTYFHRHHHTSPISLYSSPLILSFSFNRTVSLQPRLCVLRFGADGSDLLRKPIIPPGKDLDGISEEDEDSDGNKNYKEKDEEEAWVDWEDQILEDTVPLVGFVRMILHSDKYESGQKLTPEHEKTIRERLLPYHPECEKKIGCGIDYITIIQKRCTMASCISSLKDHAKAGAHELGTRVGYHPDFEASRCLFIVRKDGELVDFSYWKCIKGLIRKNYPLYADSFILRHFRQRRRNG